MLSFIGKLGKGWASIAGAAVTLAGVLFGPEIAQHVSGVSEGVTQLVTSAGALLLAFGVGRKAGYAANR